ncbi:MAG: permease [Clostridia bacterium]|nr:permease [Clostridia bacterium]
MSDLIAVFLIAVIGYLIGRITIKGIELGTAGVLLVALVFGHFGVKVSSMVRDIGLVCFVTSVGFIAGPKFFRNFKMNAKSYVALGFLVIFIGGVVCALVVKLAGIPAPLATGLLTGALTSTPGLAAAMEAAGEASEQASIGYGIAYPFGVIGVVLFVQLVPKLLKIDVEEERKHFENANLVAPIKPYHGKLIQIDPLGMFPFALAILLGLLIAKVEIPLPGGARFSLGTSGGPLIMGLVIGHLLHIEAIDLHIGKRVLETFREFGLMLFLIGAGVGAGSGFVETLKEHGVMLFLYGALMTLCPMIVGYWFASKVLKLAIFNTLGSITGGMTSTPALGTLISVAGTDDVASAYAATYPIALVMVVLISQFIVLLF